MTVERTSLEQVDPLEWDALVRARPRPSPFLLHAWLRAWWSHYGEDAELDLRVVRREGKLAGALPLCVRRRRGVRVLELVGGEQAHLADVLGDDEAAAELLESVRRHGADFADLYGVPAGGRAAALPGLRLVERVEAPVLDLGRPWTEVYAGKFSSKSRQTHRRKLRRIEDEGLVGMRLAVLPDDVQSALEESFRLHDLRWQGRRDGSDYSAERGRAFQREAYRALAADGIARVLLLELDGRAIAFNCYLVLAGRGYSHRLGFDPAYGRFSPGLLSTLHMCERAAAEGLTLVELLGGDEEYKLQLADRFEPLLEGFGLARTLRGCAAVAARAASVRARRRLKRIPALRRLYGERPLRRRTASVYAAR